MNILLDKAYDLKLILWNDGMVYSDFIQALWRTFLKHEEFSHEALKIQENLGESGSLELLSDEIDLKRR